MNLGYNEVPRKLLSTPILGRPEKRVTGHSMNGQNRKDIRAGQRVEIVLKKDQRTGKRTVGIVKDVLTSAAYHSRGIKVRLDDGRIGRVQEIPLDDMVLKERNDR